MPCKVYKDRTHNYLAPAIKFQIKSCVLHFSDYLNEIIIQYKKLYAGD
jgi:hypothetical protein